tara:strand:+ start:625 stop:2022 length:1398 start_codon:yes stop_codon:yes gene_type:complete
MKVKKKHLIRRKNNKWLLRIYPGPGIPRLQRVLKTMGEPNGHGNPPAEVFNEANELLANAVLGFDEVVAEAKLRKERVPTIQEIIDHYRGHSRVKNNLKKSSIRANINSLTKMVALVYGIETPLNQKPGCHIAKRLRRNSVKVSGSKEAAKYREEQVGKLPMTILNGALVDQYVDLRIAEGPEILSHEVRPEHLESKAGELSGPDLKRVQGSIRTELAQARGMFAHASAHVKNLICPVEGIYQKFRLPDSLMEFKKRYTFKKPGKVDYAVPTARELGKLWNGMPQLKEGQPEVYKGFKLAADTGLRLDELRFLMWDQFQERADGVFITVKDNGANAGTKSGNERPVRISQGLYEELIAMETDEIYVIGGTHEFRRWHLGKAVSAYMRSKGWKRRMCIHELRKWFGAMVADRTKSLVAVMHILGHASYATTKGTYEALVEYPVYDDITATLPGSASDPMPAKERVA